MSKNSLSQRERGQNEQELLLPGGERVRVRET